MAKEAKKGPKASKSLLYKVDGGKLERTRPHCPKCGPGTFLAKHEGRVSCGRCGYTEFAKA